MSSNSELFKLIEKKRLLEQEVELKRCLPHIYGFNFYKWQRAWMESRNHYNFLIAGNQQGKSICNVMKWVKWATTPELWPELWPEITAKGKKPRQFWILMPTRDMIAKEFKEKWEPDLLPRGKFKNDARFGWTAEFRNKHLWAIHWRTGITCYMHTYEQDVHHLQGGTVDAIFVDEELPFDLFPELNMRIQANNGYFHMVCTPTRGQEEWRKTYEVKGHGEKFPDAYKSAVTIYDCKYFEDGKPSHWTDERITQLINTCGTEAEVQLRLYGKFVAQDGLKLSAFDRAKNVVANPGPVPEDWLWYSGVDIGHGGKGHPPAIAFIAVKPDYTMGRVVRSWRGLNNRDYTSTDILNQYLEMRADKTMAGEFYDWSAADFFLVASQSDVAFQQAEKKHEIGFPMMNTLFKNEMLSVDDTPENQDFIGEAASLQIATKKTHASDDAIDSVRYGVTRIPWDFSKIDAKDLIKMKIQPKTVDEQRKSSFLVQASLEQDSIDAEIEEWNDLYEP